MPDINTIKRVDSFSLYGKLIEQFGHEDNYKNTILTHVSEDNVSYMTFSPFTESDIVKQVSDQTAERITAFSVGSCIMMHWYIDDTVGT